MLSKIEASSCELYNPFSAVRWNIDKHYLFDLEKWNIPIVPTFAASAFEPGTIQKHLADIPSQTVILKPAVGLGGSHSRRVPWNEFDPTLEDLKNIHPDDEYLIQPFIEDVLTEGEWSFIYSNRQLSHVLLKKPAPNDYRVQGIF